MEFSLPLARKAPSHEISPGMEEDIKRVWCLYRVSTAGQVDHDDIPMQRIECQEFVRNKPKWTITRELSEKGVSGYKVSSNDRDAIQEIRRAALQNEFDVLLVFMFDRLGRREDETPFVVQWLVEQNIEVWSVREGEQRFETHVDKLLNFIRYWQASGESEKTSIRISTRKQQLTEAGHYSGGLVPFGYRAEHCGRMNKKDQPVKDYVIDETEAAIVLEIFHKVVEEGWGSYRIAKWLNERGIPTKQRGKLNRGGKNPGEARWRDTSIRVILTNPMYTGRLKLRQGYTLPFEPLRIMSDDLFKKAVYILRSRYTGDPNTASVGPTKSDSGGLLTGLLHCAHCGGKMHINHCSKKPKNSGAAVRYRWDVYRCYERTKDVDQCNGPTTYSQSKVEDYVLGVVRQFFVQIGSIPEKAVCRLAKNALNREQSVQRSALENARISLERAQQEYVALQEEAVKSLTGEGRFPIDFIQEMIPARKEALEEAQSAVDEIVLAVQAEDDAINSTIERITHVKSWAERFDAANIETKRMILGQIIEKVTVGRGYKVHIDFKLTYQDFMGHEV